MSIAPYYDHAGIQIFHGDCREILPMLPCVDLVLTDPPYGVDAVYGPSYDDGRAIYWDWFLPTVEQMRAAGAVLAFTHRVKSLGKIVGWDWVGVWNKPYSAGSRIGNSWVLPHWEPIYFFGIHAAGRQGQTKTSHYRNDVFTFDPAYSGSRGFGSKERNGAGESVAHPTPKPEPLFRDLIKLLTEPNGRIIDPFMGSGTTLRAAKELDRQAIGIEIEEKYCEIAVKRLSQEVLQFNEKG